MSSAMHRGLRVVAGLGVAALLASAVLVADEAAEKAAAQVSSAWLALVDSGQYAESWKDGSSLFKNAVTMEQWEATLKNGRAPLGKLVSRKLISARFTTSLPGVPDGEYVVVQFETVFENKKAAVETVTPMKEKDGKWRVSGYYIK